MSAASGYKGYRSKRSKMAKMTLKFDRGYENDTFWGKMVNLLHLGVFPFTGSMNLWGNYGKNG